MWGLNTPYVVELSKNGCEHGPRMDPSTIWSLSSAEHEFMFWGGYCLNEFIIILVQTGESEL
jgi:hypothetical protein